MRSGGEELVSRRRADILHSILDNAPGTGQAAAGGDMLRVAITRHHREALKLLINRLLSNDRPAARADILVQERSQRIEPELMLVELIRRFPDVLADVLDDEKNAALETVGRKTYLMKLESTSGTKDDQRHFSPHWYACLSPLGRRTCSERYP